jgi:hypothetical protein
MRVKASFLSFVVMFFLVTPHLMGQKGLRVGLNLTPQFSRLNLLDPMPEGFERKYGTGFTGGAMLQYGVNAGIAFHSGLLYTSTSYTVRNPGNAFREVIRGNTGWIEVPLGFYLRQPINRQSSIRELVGLSFLYNTAKEDTSFFRFPSDNPFAIESVINSRMATTLNLGIEFVRSTEAGHLFTFGLVYKRGLGTPSTINVINDATSRTPAFELGLNAGYVGISMGYLFNLKDIKPIKGELFFE